jgi:hypothetical protein
LDFHIAFTVGELSKTDPTAYFHIISQDAGFDPLIEYARKKGVLLHRSKEIGDIPLLKLSNAKTTTEKVTAILNNLIPRGASRPRKVRTLSSTINALFKKELSETELAELIASLKKGGHISIEGENVTYHIRSTV